jgi:hypothetical protein
MFCGAQLVEQRADVSTASVQLAEVDAEIHSDRTGDPVRYSVSKRQDAVPCGGSLVERAS